MSARLTDSLVCNNNGACHSCLSLSSLALPPPPPTPQQQQANLQLTASTHKESFKQRETAPNRHKTDRCYSTSQHWRLSLHSAKGRKTRKNNKMTAMSVSAQKYSPPAKGSGHSNARTVRSGLVLHTVQTFGGLECGGWGGVRRRCDFLLLLLLLLLINKTGKTKRVELWVLNDSMELIAMCPTEDVR